MGLDGQGPDQDQQRAAIVLIDDAELDHARSGFHRKFPARSAKRVLHWTQLIALGLIGYGLWRAIVIDTDVVLRTLYVAAFALFGAAILWRLIAAARLTPLLSRLARPHHCPTYTILCPLYKEAGVVGDLIAALERIDYPDIMAQTPEAS